MINQSVENVIEGVDMDWLEEISTGYIDTNGETNGTSGQQGSSSSTPSGSAKSPSGRRPKIALHVNTQSGSNGEVSGSIPAAPRSARKRNRTGSTLSDVSGTGYNISSPRAASGAGDSSSNISSMLYFGGGQMGYSNGAMPNSAGANVRQLPALLCHRVLNGLLVHGRLPLASLLSLVPDTGGSSNRDHIMQILELLCVLGVVQNIVVRVDASSSKNNASEFLSSTSSSVSSSSSTATKQTTESVYALVGHIKGSADVPMLSGKLLEAIQAKDANTIAIRSRVVALMKLSNDISGHNAAGSYNLRQKKRAAMAEGGSDDDTDNMKTASTKTSETGGADSLSTREPQHKTTTERLAQFKALVDSFLVGDASLQDDHLYRALESGGLTIGTGRYRG